MNRRSAFFITLLLFSLVACDGGVVSSPAAPLSTSLPTRTSGSTPTPNLNTGPDPQIFSFTVTPDGGLTPGDEVLLTWEAQGEAAEVCWYNHHGVLEGRSDVAVSGSERIKLWDQNPVADHWVDFELHVARESGVYTSTKRQIRVTLVCRLPWFFSPSPDGCTDDNQEWNTDTLVGQRFERGVMLGNSYWINVYLDEPDHPYLTFSPHRPLPQADLSDETPPDGLVVPAPEFDGVWAGLLPGSEDVRDRLGWGVASAITYDSPRQCLFRQQDETASHCFRLGLDGQVYHEHWEWKHLETTVPHDGSDPMFQGWGTWQLWPNTEND